MTWLKPSARTCILSKWRTPYQSVSYDYDEENRMTEAGNVRYEYGETGGVQREIGAVHELVYSYQDERVRGITGNLPGGEQVEVTYGYDALGRRTSRRNGNDDHAIRTVYEGLSINSVMTLETDRVFAGGITGTGVNRDTGSAGTGHYRRSDGPGAGLARPASLETRTLRMGSTAVAQMTGGGDGEITFYGHDILGSVTARFSDRGQRVEELEYRAFGELRRGELTTEHPYGYTGKAMDPTTGIYDYGFRDYAPELARFTTVDPIRDGNNWYAYVGNDPVNFVDPLGLERAAGVGIRPLSQGHLSKTRIDLTFEAVPRTERLMREELLFPACTKYLLLTVDTAQNSRHVPHSVAFQQG